MFSYRHAFHAGSHADVLKHMMLIAILRHLTQKAAALTVVDTHAGAGLYRLDSDFADTSGEAATGVLKLFAALAPADPSKAAIKDIAPLIQDYMEMVAGFNPDGTLKIYPGSPFIVQRLLRQQARDKLKLFELHPTDSKVLAANVAQLEAGRQVAVTREDGFEGVKAFLPPPSRRGLVLIDPSYEIKSDYQKVSACLQDALKRFATGTYVIWYPVIPRAEAHELPRRLKTLATHAGRPWLQATLAIGQDEQRNVPGEPDQGQGLTASGMFVINPPHSLKPGLAGALPQLLQVLGRGRGQAQTLESGGT
jgi:23S rRNA (adenine2030-N6)-methyltransferase